MHLYALLLALALLPPQVSDAEKHVVLRVRDAASRPVSAAVVHVWSTRAAFEQHPDQSDSRYVTGPYGLCTLPVMRFFAPVLVEHELAGTSGLALWNELTARSGIVDITLAPPRTLSGRVFGEDGLPAAGVPVDVVVPKSWARTFEPRPPDTVLSDRWGRFRVVIDVPAPLEVSTPISATKALGLNWLQDVLPGHDSSEVHPLILRPPVDFVVRGVVESPPGASPAGHTIRVTRSPREKAAALTDWAGRFEMRVPSAGSYDVVVDPYGSSAGSSAGRNGPQLLLAEPRSVTLSDKRSTAELNLPLVLATSLSGRVEFLSENRPPEGLKVHAAVARFSPSGRRIWGWEQISSPEDAEVESDGGFEFPMLHPALSYDLDVTLDTALYGPDRWVGGQPGVPVGGAEALIVLDERALEPATLHGRVVSVVDAVPVETFQIEFAVRTAPYEWFYSLVRPAMEPFNGSGARGEFEVVLPDYARSVHDRLFCRFSAPGHGSTVVGPLDRAALFEPLSIALPLRVEAHIVTRLAGRGVGDVNVILFTTAPFTKAPPSLQRIAKGRSGPAGRYSPGEMSGRLLIVHAHGEGGDAYARVETIEGLVEDIVLDLSAELPPATLTLEISGSRGVLLSGQSVAVSGVCPGSQGITETSQTDDTGRVSFNACTPGIYRVSTESAGWLLLDVAPGEQFYRLDLTY